MASRISLKVNGITHQVDVSDPGMPLLWVLRDILGLTGTKYGCGIEVCGACTVLVDNQRERSCVVNVGSMAGRSIVTIEGLANDADGKKAQAAWIANQVPQCGYCQPGMLMACTGAMKGGHHGSEIGAEMPHLCVCGTYPRIRIAIQAL